VAPLIRVGTDAVGSEVVAELKRRRLITSLVQYDRKVATGFSVILNSSVDREHTIFTYKAASKHLVAPNVKKIKTAWFYFSPLSMKNWWDFMAPFVAQVKATAKKSPRSRVRIAWNPGSKQLLSYKRMLPILPFVDILILNKDEAIEFVINVWKKRVTKRELNKVEVLLKKIKSLGVANLVITDGAQGASGLGSDNKFYHRDSVRTKIIDTVGAGDAFAAGFLANFSRTDNFSRALYAGVKNSALVLSGVGNRPLHEIK
jgi:sugar/nucleoside kinase (ribokinase family)